MTTRKKVVPDSFQAFLVSDAHFTANEEYPILEEGMIAQTPPSKILPFEFALQYSGDLSNIFICFYSKDQTFEEVRQNPQNYLSLFQRCAGIIGFDFSIHTDMPIVKQKAQMNDNLSLTYYFASHGIKVIPNIRYGIDELGDEFFDAIPKNSLVAIGTHGFYQRKDQKDLWHYLIGIIIKRLNPKGIIVYGSFDKAFFSEYLSLTNFYIFKPINKYNIEEEIANAI